MLFQFALDLLATHSRYEAERRKEVERKWREALEIAFESVPGDRRFCVRKTEVMDHVAWTLGIRAVNNNTFRQLVRIGELLGWESVKNGNRSLFRCVKPRSLDAITALAVSRKHRRDPRVKVGKGGNVPRSVATIPNLNVACTP